MKIIVITDAQYDFINGVLGSKEAQIAADNIVNFFHEYNEPNTLVLFTKDTHYENYLDTAEGQKLPIEHCLYGTSGWSIYKPISQEIDYSCKFLTYSSPLIKKGRILKSAFGSTALVNVIENLNMQYTIDEIVFVGFCTDICVISNVITLKTHCPEIPITVKETCCAGTTPEAHEAALKVMRSCQIKIVD